MFERHPSQREIFRIMTALLFLGSGSVDAQTPLLVPAPGSPVTVGRDRDGNLDMVTRHLLDLRVRFFRGDGKGGFTAFPGGQLRLNDQPGSVVLADINNDGNLDLLVTRNHSDAVDVFLGDGKGGFLPAPGSPFTASPSTAPFTHGLDLVDLNEDGKLDLVTTNGKSHELGILFGDGRGRFAAGPPVRLDLGVSQTFYAIGDVDDDGHVDLVTVSSGMDDPGPASLRIWHGDGKGRFSPQPGPSLPLPAEAHSLMLAKIGNDGRQAIITSHARGYINVLQKRGTGPFEPLPGSPYHVDREVYGLIVADVNADHHTDLIAATVDSVTVLLGNGEGFSRTPQSFPAGPGAYKVATADLNNDGTPDVAASSFEGDAVTILLGRYRQRAGVADVFPRFLQAAHPQ
jgi:hypothetical protein